MNTRKLATLAILMTFGAAMAQEVEKKMEIKVMVTGDDGDETSEVHWVSDDMGFDMQDLAVGETRTIEGEAGKTVTVTREEEGFSIDVEGKTVTIPNMGEHGTHMAFIGEGGEHQEFDVQVMGGSHMMQAHHPDGITIVSGKALDDSVKDSIRSVLISAGNDDEVTFIDGSEGGKRVMVKKIEITN